jgi:hypothetical protein
MPQHALHGGQIQIQFARRAARAAPAGRSLLRLPGHRLIFASTPAPAVESAAIAPSGIHAAARAPVIATPPSTAPMPAGQRCRPPAQAAGIGQRVRAFEEATDKATGRSPIPQWELLPGA